MAAPAITVSLEQGISSVSPVSREVMAALTRIEVRRGATAPSGFQLSFVANVAHDEIDLIAAQFGDPFSRVVVKVDASSLESGDANSFSGVLIDGFVTAQEYSPPAANRPGTFTVTGEDASVKMDMVERSVEYPDMSDGDIVSAILRRYGSLVDPSVTPPEIDTPPALYVTQQNGTDLAYLKHLARRHSAVFYIAAGSSGKPVAYWGPPRKASQSVRALTVGAGSFGNVIDMRFRRSMLAPTVAYGAVLDVSVSPPTRQAVAVGSASRSLGYARSPDLSGGDAISGNPESYTSDLTDLHIRGTIAHDPGLDAASAGAIAQGLVDLSQDGVVVATGSVDTATYGDLLLAPGMVEVRGAGASYDGKYYLSESVHVIDFADNDQRYTQQFTMMRDGVGATVNSVTP